MSKLWLVKDKKSRISGPYDEEEILYRIETGEFNGEELIASYPSGRWKPLTVYSVFYDKFLKSLNTSSSTEEDSSLSEEKQEKFIEPTVIIPQKPKLKDSKKPERKKVKIKFHDPDGEIEETETEEVIEMEDFQESFVNRLRTAIRLPLLVLSILIGGFLIYEFSTDSSSDLEYRVRLQGPKKKSPPLSAEILQQKKRKAITYYLKGDLSNYIKSQTHLAQILEGHPDFMEGYKYLCLIYLELWPFAWQDTRDYNALQTVMGNLGNLDKGGAYSGLCNGIQEFLKGNYKKTIEIADSFSNIAGMDKMIPYFYYMKAKALKKLNRTNDTLFYTRGATLLNSKWTAPYFLAGEVHYERGEFPPAIQFFQKTLGVFPEHKEAGLLLGITEYKYLKQTEKPAKRLSSFLNRDSGFVNTEILKEAYMTMAKIFLQQRDKSAALKNAMKAYTFDPANEEINAFITRLGGEKPGEEDVKTRQLIYKGDLLADQGNCVKAQTFYKKAFEVDKEKNALAAVRMGQCFWKGGISGQAVQWLKKAISADPKRVETYFLLADYYSAMYAFEDAKDILSIAARQNPNSYEVFKGYALVAFRQQNYNSVIYYGKRARKLYSSDIEVDLILSKAYRALGSHNKEFDHAEKAVEANVNSTEAQINFGWAKSSAYGFFRGEQHFIHLIRKFPLTVEYRQALGEYYFENERNDKAKETFEILLSHEPDFKPAYIYLGRIHTLTGSIQQKEEELDMADKYFLQASLLDPSDPEPLFRLGLVSMEKKKYSDAETQFERVVGINSRYPLIHYYIGKVNFLDGGKENLERALEASKTESKKNPNLAMAYILTGDIYKTKAKKARNAFHRRTFYELCVKEYQNALKLRKKDVDLYVQLINCYRGAGELDSALQLANQVIETHGISGYPELYRQLGLIFELKGDIANARTAYKHYFALLPGAPDKARIERRLNSQLTGKRAKK